MAPGLAEGLAVKASVKDQWVKDLRSGEFEQGNGYLRRADSEGGKDRLCCLGVLSEQAVRAGVIPAPELHGRDYHYLDDETDHRGNVLGEKFNQCTALPRKVAEWAGIKDDYPESMDSGWDVTIMPRDSDGGEVTAIGANDGMSLTFVQIADLIDANVPAE